LCAERPASGGCATRLNSESRSAAHLRELLRRAGYEVHTSSKLGDALLLMRVTRFDLLLLGPGMTASAATQQSFQAASAGVPVVELGSEFSTHDAGEAGADVLRKIDDRLNPKTA
jgi:DNA-binding response OmpR family regulator